MNVYLKIKIKSLAAEAKIIRREEHRAKARPREAGSPPPPVFFGLQEHRTGIVRGEARSGCLAYGFLRGRAYRAMEARCHTPPDWKRVETLVSKYGQGDTRTLMQQFSEWKDAA